MYFYEKLQDLIGIEVELFENRNTGRLEIRPADIDAKKSGTGRFIGDVGEDCITIEVRGVGRPYYDVYPFAQVTLRGWDSRVVSGAGKKQRATPSAGSQSTQRGKAGSHDWLG